MASSGEAQIVKASEEVQRRNLQGVIEHVNGSRKIVNGLTTQVQTLALQNVQQGKEITELRTAMSLLQAKVYQLGNQ